MLMSLTLMLAQADGQVSQVYGLPSYFLPVFIALLLASALGCLIAVVLGFGRARTHGASARWFALAAACLFLYHVHLIVMSFASISGRAGLAFPLITFLNLFILLAAICIVIGFMKMPPAGPIVDAALTEAAEFDE